MGVGAALPLVTEQRPQFPRGGPYRRTGSHPRLREAMLPYTYTVAHQAMTTGVSMARPLWLEFPSDPFAYQAPSEYLWGDSLLVAPVTTAVRPDRPLSSGAACWC